MSMNIKTIFVGAGMLALTACGEAGTFGSFHQEAGAFLDEGGFGNPTMHNMLAQKCVGAPKGFIEPDPVVALNPTGPNATPVYARYSVYCSGALNGKYAQVIFREYVRSAVPPSSLGGGLQVIEGAAGGG